MAQGGINAGAASRGRVRAGAVPAELSRPALRWHGGKWVQAPHIIALMPAHRVYVEPFGGAASVLLRKPRSYAEIYNDLDSHVVQLFRVLRDDALAARLLQQLELTPFARDEFDGAYDDCDDDPVEASRRLIVKSFMGFGSDGATGQYRTGFRSASNRSGTTPATDWRHYPDALPAIIDRLRGVVIENRDAAEVMRRHDCKDALHFVDPPYLLSLRTRTGRRPGGGTYRHELTEEDHAALLSAVAELEGMVMLCGYASPLYDDALPGWLRIERAALADGAQARTEVLWMNPAAAGAMPQSGLFDQ